MIGPEQTQPSPDSSLPETLRSGHIDQSTLHDVDESIIEAVHTAEAADKLGGIIEKNQDFPLSKYGEGFLFNPSEEAQPGGRLEFITACVEVTRRIHGDAMSEKVYQSLMNPLNKNSAWERFIGGEAKDYTPQGPVVLSGPHMAPITASRITAQSSAVFALNAVDLDAVVVLATTLNSFANSLSRPSITFTRGEQKIGGPRPTFGPIRYSWYPSRERDTLVAAADPFTRDMVDRMHKRIQEDQRLTETEKLGATVLYRLLMQPEVIRQETYPDQISAFNKLAFKEMFAVEANGMVPEMIYLDLEEVTTQLLEKDLQNENSVIYNIFFNPALRTEVLARLSGTQGCWNSAFMEEAVSETTSQEKRNEIFHRRAGTVLFWGVERKRQYPFAYVEEDGKAFLQRADIDPKEARHTRIPFTPDAILKALKEKKMLPNVFTDIVVTLLARGVKGYGGFNQITYFPKIMEGLVEAFLRVDSDRYGKVAGAMKTVPAENYVVGLGAAISAVFPDGNRRAAGAIEIIAQGGLTVDNIVSIQALPVKAAQAAGMPISTHQYTGITRMIERGNFSLRQDFLREIKLDEERKTVEIVQIKMQ